MSTYTGRTILIPIADFEDGMQIMNNGLVCKILSCKDTNSICVETVKGKIRSYHTAYELSRFIIEYTKKMCHRQAGCDCLGSEKEKCGHFYPASCRAHLDSSQWETAVNGAEIKFEITNPNFGGAKIGKIIK